MANQDEVVVIPNEHGETAVKVEFGLFESGIGEVEVTTDWTS